jgi:hypothetical protein
MRIALVVIVLSLVVLAAFAVFSRPTNAPSVVYSLSDIEFADTSLERERGLSGRAVLPDDYGMLFVFPEPDLYGFWMKDMLVPIDIIWVNADGTIAGITESISPDTYPAAFFPPAPVPYVLEVRAGLSRERGWATSTALSLPLP